MYDILTLNDMLVSELRELAEQLNLQDYKDLKKQDLIYKILEHQAVSTPAPRGESKNVRRPKNQDKPAPKTETPAAEGKPEQEDKRKKGRTRNEATVAEKRSDATPEKEEKAAEPAGEKREPRERREKNRERNNNRED